MFRTVPASWFEELIARPMLARSVEVLAATGVVEFDFIKSDNPALELSALRDRLEVWEAIEKRYGNYLPVPTVPDEVGAERLEKVIDRNLECLKTWEAAASDIVTELDELRHSRWQLEEIIDFLSLLNHTRLDLGALHNAAPVLATRLFVLPPDTETPEAAKRILHLRMEGDQAGYLLTLGTPDETEEADRALTGLDGRGLPLPEWLTGPVPDALALAKSKHAEVIERVRQCESALGEITDEFRVADALGELHRLAWLVEHLEGVPVGEYFAHVTGWTSDTQGQRLRAALEAAQLPTVVYLAEPPADKTPPSLVRNPVWIRPFEFFGRLMGTPGSAEADPSPFLAIVAPLLFGYMFGDVGHGLVIFMAGLLLRKRWPPAAMLISGGVVSIVFGFLYGSLFTYEHLIPALWIKPFEEPLLVLFIPLFLGAFLIVLGMALNGFSHFWAGKGDYWLRCEAGLLLAYVAAWLSVLNSSWLPWVVAGVVWHLAGNVWVNREDGAGALGAAVGDLFEYALQLAVNTISFVRVGAFALAHAGLGATVFSLADSSQTLMASVLILIVGNIAIIALEGLVVSVQTTRLLLFEFFIRFLKAGGRPFVPMVPPDYGRTESLRETPK